MGDNRKARIIGLAVVLVGIVGLFGGAAAALAQESRCTNTGRTCSEARSQGLAWCNASSKDPAGCRGTVEMSFQGCLQQGIWKTRFCNRKGLTKR